MIRIIVQTDDASMAANVGGNVLTTCKSFEIDAPALEQFLAEQGKENSLYVQRQIIGWEPL